MASRVGVDGLWRRVLTTVTEQPDRALHQQALQEALGRRSRVGRRLLRNHLAAMQTAGLVTVCQGIVRPTSKGLAQLAL